MLDTTNELITNQGGMTSLEIAEVTGKRHDAILRDIRNLLKQGVNAHNFVVVEYTDKKGEKRPLFNLTPKGCLILASGYDAVLREKIIDKLDVLESGKPKVPHTFSEALMLAAQQAKRIEVLQTENHVLRIESQDYKMKAAFADCFLSCKGDIAIGDMANILNQNGLYNKGRNALLKWFRCNGYLLKHGLRYNMPSQKSISNRWMKVVIESTSLTGYNVYHSRAVLTPVGVKYFIGLFRKLKSDKSTLTIW